MICRSWVLSAPILDCWKNIEKLTPAISFSASCITKYYIFSNLLYLLSDKALFVLSRTFLRSWKWHKKSLPRRSTNGIIWFCKVSVDNIPSIDWTEKTKSTWLCNQVPKWHSFGMKIAVFLRCKGLEKAGEWVDTATWVQKKHLFSCGIIPWK